jgi:hypothetical protein
MYPGGIADKTGNRFEARWLTRQMLGLLDGTAISITVEKIGDGDEGFEFLVKRPGAVEWHQCKRQTSETSWTITALAREAIIDNFSAKLRLSPSQRCVFVSTDIAKQVKLLQEKRAYAPSLAEFEKILSKDETASWQQLQDKLGFGGDAALDWIDRCAFHTLSEAFLESVVASEVAFWFKGEPEKLIAAVRIWVEGDATLNRPITRADFLAFGQEKGFDVKQYEVDQAMPGRLAGATASYDASYASIGAGVFRIPRIETDCLLAALLDEPSSKTVALVGSAGSGKSVIIRDAIERIAGRNHMQLAFRVDQVGEPASLAQLGTAVIDVADSPAIVHERLSGNRPAVLYIDQADAVSQMSGRSAQVRRQLVDLVNQARSYPNIRLVFSCRTFDVENDQFFSEIAERKDTLRIDVASFDWERDVVPVLQRLEISINPDSQKIRALLIQPIGLAIAAQLAANGIKDLRTVENLSELFDKLLTERDRAIRERHKPAWSVYAVLEAIAREMSARQELVAPLRTLDPFAGAREILQQEGLIVVNGQKISLLHESLFDFLHARAFAGGDHSLLDFLLSSEQTLFRRTQVRQILAAEREIDPKRYLADLESILTSDQVRPHVRDLVLRWLGSVPLPTTDEWNQLARYAARQRDAEVPRSISMVIFDQPAWFALLAEGGIVQAWLQGSKDAQVWALRFIRSISDRGADLLPAILQDYLDANPERAGLILDELHWLSPKQPAPALADVIIRALGMIDDLKHFEARGEGQFEAHGSWIPHAPDDAARILAACLSTWYRLTAEGTPFKPAFENGTGTFHHLVELAKARPIAMLDTLLPAMREAMVRMPGPEGGPPFQDHIWHWRRYERGEDAWVEMLDVVRNALAQVAIDDPAEAERLLAIVEPAQQITGLHLLLEAVASNGAGLAGALAAQQDHTALFKAGWEGAPALSAAKALAASWDHLQPDQRVQFERRILALWPEFDDVKWALSLKDPGKNAFNQSLEEIRRMARHYLGLSGLRQWSVLRLIGEERLSPAAAERLRFLARKFAGFSPESPNISRSGSVQSPIAPDRAAHMSDDAWLTAFDKLNGEGKREWTAAGFLGSAYELACVLQARVKEEPERFFGLLHRIPIDAHPAFANAIVMGISESSPGAERTERLFAAVDEKAVPRLEERTLVWLVRATQGEKGPHTLRFMLEAATSGDSDSGVAERVEGKSEKEEIDIKRAFSLGSFLDARAMNSARGSALQEMGALAWDSADKFKEYHAVVDPIVGSEMPDFLHAGLGAMLLAALKHDLEVARDWIVRTAKASPTALFIRNGRRALLWLDARAPDVAGPIIKSYAESPDPLAQAIGALLVAQRSLEDERWKDPIGTLIEQGPTQRAAIAEVANAYVAVAEHVGRASAWLIRFFDDDNTGVRKTAADCFRRINPSTMAIHVPLYEAYVGSKYFDGARSYFIHRLEKAPAAMDDVVLGLIERTVEAVKAGGSGGGHGLYQIWDPLLRIYASCGVDGDRLKRCLDVIDMLVQLDAVGSSKLNALT